MNDRSRRNLLPDHQSQLLQNSNNQDYNLEHFSSHSSLSMPLPQPRRPQFPDKAATPQGGQRYSMNTLRGNVVTFGNLAIQKLIDVVNSDKLDQILDLLIIDHNRFDHVCTDQHGSKRKQSTLASALSNTAWSLTMSVYSSSLIYQCLKNFSPQFKQQLLLAIADNCLVIGRNLIRSCFLRQCFAEADDEIFDSLAPAIAQNADTFSKSRHGNYVVQRIIEMKKLEINRDITTKLLGKFVRLSMNQQGCHVVQKLMKDSGLEEVVDTVLTDILDSSSPLQVCQDRYGNYVVQAAITRIKEGLLFDRLRVFIEDNKIRLRKKGHGKWVWDAMNARLRAIKERIDIQDISNV
ncbi:hypothetical protein TIFTF001_007124 [Ficus carica]|uniref:PUM-HD domain-containing protein n=1 Tax=Ficus carica TaxID=3494 RepID=A0AA87ZPE1_FICCA|nr:hypothetical protein TIFTF001_007124 [Ficus carica]